MKKHKELSDDVREKLLHAFDLFNSLLQMQRICIGNSFDIKTTSTGYTEIICSSMDMPDLTAAEAYLKTLQKEVREIFTGLLK